MLEKSCAQKAKVLGVGTTQHRKSTQIKSTKSSFQTRHASKVFSSFCISFFFGPPRPCDSDANGHLHPEVPGALYPPTVEFIDCSQALLIYVLCFHFPATDPIQLGGWRYPWTTRRSTGQSLKRRWSKVLARYSTT